ncbi:MAG: glycosyltransferase family 2 protein [Candidatus Omnitrophica bacterium]|nr:glycosyltransferase family 2 protein [Candidatus Omnitrophota bacterium]MDD5653758.1 glycosyltransferase family 2 protein [Candidatus Omnitrophota bacterium]
MMSNKISVIVPVYNAGGTLRECLSAIFNSDYKEFEVIVVDDNSTDDSVIIAKEFAARIILFSSNKGVAAARNKGVEEAKGDYLLFVDSDCIIKPDSIAKVVDGLSKDNSISGIAGIYALHNRFNNFLSQYKHLIEYYRGITCEDVNRHSFRGAFFAVRKGVFDSVRFDESLKNASIEDIEFGRELIASGHKFLLDKSIEVEHVKKRTLKGFFRNQFFRSKDIARSFFAKKSYKFYLSKKRKSVYAKLYFLRVPVSLALFAALCGFLITGNSAYLYPALFLSILPVFLEYEFLKFCLKQKGLGFVIQCIFVYFFDGLVSALGVFAGLVKSLTERKV